MAVYSNQNYSSLYFTQSYENSGALKLADAEIIIENCSFKDNGGRQFSTYGGAVATFDEAVQSVTISNTTFSNNYAQHGGAIAASKTLNLIDVTFTNNHAEPYSYAGYGGAIFIQGCRELNYTVTSGHDISNQGNYGAIGGFLHDHDGQSIFTFDVQSNASLTIGATNTSTDSINLHKGSKLIKTGAGTMTINSVLERRHPYTDEGSITDGDITVESGILKLNCGGTFDGSVKISGGQLDLGANYSFTSVEFELVNGTSLAMVSDWSKLSATRITIDISEAAAGSYVLAANAGTFNRSVTITDNEVSQTISNGQSVTIGGTLYSLNVANGNLTLTAGGGLETGSLVVTTAADIEDANDGVTSLREAISYARSLGGEQTITFNIANTDTLVLDNTIKITTSVIIDGTNSATGNNVTLRTAVTDAEARQNNSAASDYVLLNFSGANLTLNNLTLMGGNQDVVSFEESAEHFYSDGLTIKDSSRQIGGDYNVDYADINHFYSVNCAFGLGFGKNAVVRNSTFDGSLIHGSNEVNGGLLGLNDGSTLTVINSTLLNNDASHSGSAMYIGTGSTVNLVNTTIENARGYLGYGNSLCSVLGGQFNLLNTIVVTPDGWRTPDIGAAFGSSNTIRYSVYGTASSANTAANSYSGYDSEDLFVTAGQTSDNGGVTPTITILSSADVLNNAVLAAVDTETHTLYYSTDNGSSWKLYSDGSAANVDAAWIIDTDQNGISRLTGNKIGASVVTDAEPAPITDPLIVTTAEDVVDANDGKTSLSEAITYALSLGGEQTIGFNMKNGDTVYINDPSLVSRNIQFAPTNAANDNPVTVVLNELSISGRRTSRPESLSGDEGGGAVMFLNSGNISVVGGEYSNNRDSGSGGFGGVFRLWDSATLTVDDATFQNNYAYSTGGAIIADKSFVTIRNSHFEGNSVAGYGGAVDINSGNCIIVDTDFVNNSTGHSGSSWFWSGGAINLECSNLVYEVSADKTISNIGNDSSYGGFLVLRISDDTASLVEFKVDGILNIGTGNGKDSIASGTQSKDSDHLIRKSGSGTMTINAPSSAYKGKWIIEDGVLAFDYASGGSFSGDITISGGQMALGGAYTFSKLTFALSEANETAYISNLANLTGGTFTVDAGDAEVGTYLLAGNAANFNSAISLTVGEDTFANALTVGNSYTVGERDYSLAVDGSNALTLTVASNSTPDPLVVTTAEDVVDANDGKTSLREAVAYAQSLGGATVTFNGYFDIQLSSSLSVSKNTVIDGGNFSVRISGSEDAPVFQLAKASLTLKNLTISSPYSGDGAGIVAVTTGSQVDLHAVKDGGNADVLWSVSGNSEIHAYDESMLHRVGLLTDTSVWGTSIVKVFDSAQIEDISIAGQQARDGGDAAIYGLVKNLTVLGLGDAYVYDGGTAENVRVENNGIIIAQAGGTINGLTLEYGGVYAYTEGSFLEGTVIIGGAARAVAATDSSIVSNTASVIFDLSQRTEDSNFTFTHLHPGFGSAASVQGNLLVDSIRPISGASSFTVNVSNDQEYGTYKLAGNAAGFNSAMSLTVGENTYANVLTVGGSYKTGDRDYSLAVDNNNILTLSIAASSTPEPVSPLVVTTAADVVDANDGVTSLREAISLAASDDSLRGADGKFTITFDDSIFTGDTAVITVGSTLNITRFLSSYGELVIQGNTDGKSVVLDGNETIRIMNIKSENTVTVDHLTIRNGRSGNDGGGAIYNNGALTITNSTFSGNYGFDGGAIFTDNGTLTISDSMFTGNTASAAGAIYNGGASVLTIYDSIFSENSTPYFSGAIHNNGTVRIAGSTFTGNSTMHGGAIFTDGPVLTISNSTFTGNSASSGGGAIKNSNGGTLVTITGSTFTGNSANYGDSLYGYSGTTNLVNNIFVGNNMNINQLVTDVNNLYYSTATVAEVFAEVDENGKAVLNEDGTFHILADGKAAGTGVYVWHNEDYTAIAYSETYSGAKTAVIGDVADATILSTDQLGAERSTDTTDIGAKLVDRNPEITQLVVTTAADVVDANDGVTSLREAISYAQSLGGEQTITFAENYAVTVGNEIRIDSAITISAAEDQDVVVDGGGTLRNYSPNAALFHAYYNSNVSLNNLTVQNYLIDTVCGAVLNWATMTVNNCQFVGNVGAASLSAGGWGVAVTTVNNSIFEGNSTSSNAGAFWNDGRTCVVDGCIFSGNSASLNGGAIYSSHGDYGNDTLLTIKDSVFETSTDSIWTNGNTVLQGTISLAANFYSTKIVNADGATINYLLSSYDSANSTVIVSDITKISGASYLVTVADNQTYGTYKLAGNAADFNSAISLTVGETTFADALTVGSSYTVNGREYTLGRNSDNMLTLNIELAGSDSADPDDEISEARLLTASVKDSVENARDVDLYAFTVNADEKIMLQTAADGDNLTVDTYLRLFNADGNELASDDDGGINHYSRLRYTFREAGTYYVGVSYYTNTGYDVLTGGNDRDGKTGSYELSLSRLGYDDSDDQLSEANFLAEDATAADKISYGSDVDMFSFSVEENDIKRFYLDSPDGADLYMRIFSAAGKELSAGVPELEYSFGQAGTYYIGISGGGNREYDPGSGTGDTETSTPGSYELRYETQEGRYDDPDDKLSTANVAESNNLVLTGELEAGTDVDMYKFTVRADEELTFSLSGTAGGTDFDSYLRLFDAEGRQLSFNDDDESGSWSQLTYRSEEDGTVYLGISANGNTDYNPLTGEGDVNSETGDYTLTVRSRMTRTVFLSSATDLGAVTLTGPVVSSASIDRPNQINMYSFDVSANDTVWINLDNLAGSNLDSYFRLFDAAGTQLAFNDDGAAAGESSRTCESYLEYTFTEAGKYYLGVSSYGNQDYEVMSNELLQSGNSTGTYRLAFGLITEDTDDDDTLDSATELSHAVHSDTLDSATDVDMYKVNLRRGETLTATITLHGLLDSYLRLFDAQGNELAANDDGGFKGKANAHASQIVWQAQEDGVYYLGVSGYGNTVYNPIDGSHDKESRYTGNYSIKAQIKAAKNIIADDSYENNDTMASAASLGTASGILTVSSLTMNDKADWYKFTTANDTGVESMVSLASSDSSANLSLNVYLSDGTLVGYAVDGQAGVSLANLVAGDYYIQVTGSETDDYCISLNVTAAPAASAANTAENYVVLFSGGYNTANNRPYYYDSIKHMYEIATQTYGVATDHVYVLFADGTNCSVDNNWGQNSDMSFAAGSVVLSATESNLRRVFEEVAAAADGNDHFLFYSFDHGSQSRSGKDYLCGWNEMISDTDFAVYADEINAGYQTYLMAECYSGGMIEDLTIKSNLYAASASDAQKPSTSRVSSITGKIAGGFSKSVEDALASGINTTYALYQNMLETNPSVHSDNPQQIGADITIFATGTEQNDLIIDNYDSIDDISIDENSVPSGSFVNKNGNYAPVITAFNIFDEEAYWSISQAEIGSTVALSVKTYDPDSEDTVAKVEFYYTDASGKQQLIAVDNDGNDGWQYFWTLTNELTPGYCTLAAVSQDSYGNYSQFFDLDFRILEQNFHPEITSIALDAASYLKGQTVTVSGIAQDSDGNGIDSVRIYFDSDKDGFAAYPDEFLGLAQVNPDGSWSYSFTLDSSMEIGSYTIFAEAVDSLDMLTGQAVGIDFLVSDIYVSNLEISSDFIQWKKTSSDVCVIEYSQDTFQTAFGVASEGTSLDVINRAGGEYQIRARYETAPTWNDSLSVSFETPAEGPVRLVSTANGAGDIFFAGSSQTWGSRYHAQHSGSVNDWAGTGERTALSGKNKIVDIFEGSSDANILALTDDANGDALFVDDIYSAFPDEQQARIAQINEIRAGAGDDIVDMTSQRFEYTGDGLIIRGGSGNDTIWANKGGNFLFGDAGNDRLVGASGNDVLAGGSGNDSMHGGSGDDIFAFGMNWGADTVEQLEGGSVTLWFESGDLDKWNAGSCTYTDGQNSVTVSGVTADQVMLKFGSDDSVQFDLLSDLGVFTDYSSENIFEENGKGILACL